jgi:methionine-rich copper-binding protein CopC
MIMRTLAAAAAMAALTTPAMAHAFLQHASPGAGAALSSAPKEIVLTFTERIEPGFSGVSVTGTDGRDEKASAAVIEGGSMTLALKKLTPGTYHVSWHVVSVDTHRTEGAYSFTVKP